MATIVSEKVKFDLEFLLKTSPRVLDNMIGTPSGLSEWFADNVNIKDDEYTFFWDGSIQSARLISRKPNAGIRFQWIEDEEEDMDTYFEMTITVDPMTKAVIMSVTDFAEEDEVDESRRLWEKQISNLRRVLGA
jgi:hypothetical protein